MLRITIVFLVLALIAAVFSFGVVANFTRETTTIVVAIVLVCAALAYLGGTFSRQKIRRRAFWEYYGEWHIRNAPDAQAARRGRTAPAKSSLDRSGQSAEGSGRHPAQRVRRAATNDEIALVPSRLRPEVRPTMEFQ